MLWVIVFIVFAIGSLVMGIDAWRQKNLTACYLGISGFVGWLVAALLKLFL